MSQHALADGTAGLFNSKRFSDLIIRCDDRKWYAHKSVVCTQSDFIQKACEGGFQEASSGYVDLDDDDPVVVDALLMYLYTGDYSDSIQENDSRSIPVFNVQVFALAEKLCVKPLMHAAAAKFKAIAPGYGGGNILADAIEEWANSTSDIDLILGDVILKIVLDLRSDIFKLGDPFPRIKSLIGRIPWLAAQTAQVLSLTLDLNKHNAIYRCPNSRCRQAFMADVFAERKTNVTCMTCGDETNMSAAGWEPYRISFTVLRATDDGDEMNEG